MGLSHKQLIHLHFITDNDTLTATGPPHG